MNLCAFTGRRVCQVSDSARNLATISLIHMSALQTLIAHWLLCRIMLITSFAANCDSHGVGQRARHSVEFETSVSRRVHRTCDKLTFILLMICEPEFIIKSLSASEGMSLCCVVAKPEKETYLHCRLQDCTNRESLRS